MQLSGMGRRVALLTANDTQECVTSIFMLQRVSELG
jgi:hypothetical protein